MNKKLWIIIILINILPLIGCEDMPSEKSANQLIDELKVINNLIFFQKSSKTPPLWPFSDKYLVKKHALLKMLKVQTNGQADFNRTLDLLVIEQRFTERFFPWPFNSNPISNYVKSTQAIDLPAVNEFLDNVITTMQLAANDNIKLNRIELDMLKNQVANAKSMVDSKAILFSLTDVELYLAEYTPRRSLGLGSLPNGKQWYQARLNYFLNQALSPQEILAHIITSQARLNSNEQFLQCFISDNCKNSRGIDWRSGYSDRLLEFKNIQFGLEQAIIAEVDFGIHSQAWSQEHAITVLTTKLSLDRLQAERVLKKIIIEPALALVNLPINYHDLGQGN